MTLTARRARAVDAQILLDWRNDPQTRAMAVHAAEVAPDEHRAWLESRLADPGTVLLIVEQSGTPVGTVRLDRRAASSAEVSITIAPAARGRGLARPSIELAVDEARAWGATEATARIRRDNEPSLRAFRAVGFRVRREGDAEELVELARPLA